MTTKNKQPISLKKSAVLCLAPHARLPPQFFPPSLQFYAQSGQEKPSENGVSVSENFLLICRAADFFVHLCF